jgi:hypothetical protein
MSEGVIFGIGGVLFIGTTWATIAFFLSRLNELHRREVLESPAVERIESDTFTEVYVKTPDDVSQVPASESLDVAPSGGSQPG